MYSANGRKRSSCHRVHWFNLQKLRFKKQLVSIVRRRQAISTLSIKTTKPASSSELPLLCCAFVKNDCFCANCFAALQTGECGKLSCRYRADDVKAGSSIVRRWSWGPWRSWRSQPQATQTAPSDWAFRACDHSRRLHGLCSLSAMYTIKGACWVAVEL